MGNVLKFGSAEEYADRLRAEWADSLTEHMEARSLNRKQLLQAVNDVAAKPVSRQTIDMWLNGKTSPSPYHQAVLAAVLLVPVRRLFPIEAAA